MSPTDLQSPNCKLETRNSACLPPSAPLCRQLLPTVPAHFGIFHIFTRHMLRGPHTQREEALAPGNRPVQCGQADRGGKERDREDSGPHATCNINICHDIYVLCLSTPDDDDDDDDGDGALWPPLRALGVASNVLKASSHLGGAAERRGVEGVRGHCLVVAD